MPFDLAEYIKAAGTTRRKRIVLLPIEPTAAQATDLARLYLSVVRVWQAGVPRILTEYGRTLDQTLRTDSAEDIETTINETEGGAVQASVTFRRDFVEWEQRVSNYHLKKFVGQLKYSTGVDLNTVLMGSGNQTLADVLLRNVSLVRNVSDETRAKISDAVLRGLQARTPVRDIAKELANITGLARDRSIRIASDQTVKLSSALDRERQTQMGMNSFEWRHSGKKHFRPEHLARNGQVFAWTSDVARNDPPGFAPFCGCKALGVLVLDED